MKVSAHGTEFWIFLRPEHYLMMNRGNECLLTVNEELSTLEGEYTILLGAPFLRAYYSIYDMDENKIGLVPMF